MSALPVTAFPDTSTMSGASLSITPLRPRGARPVPPSQRRPLPAGRLDGASPETVAAEARQANRDLEGRPAEEVLRWAIDAFGGRFCVTSSMQDMALAHLASTVAPGVDVVFLDTGYHFAETIGTRDAVEATMDVRVINVRPTQTVAEQDATLGPRLHDRNPELCCQLRKVAPLARALDNYDAYATGVRRVDSPVRALTPVVQWDPKKQSVKIAPLVNWTDNDVEDYIEQHGVLVNPLMDDGYPSVGCAPCTSQVADGEDVRSGRWAGRAKSECGLHL
ncbi:MAG TPA: phosphoadenylyl-sulfate reductase [Actinopolymorphaceae bacterium]